MRELYGVLQVISLAALLAGSPALDADSSETGEDPGTVVVSEDLTVEEIAPGIWRHVSFDEIPGFGRSPANGLVVLGDGEAALIDTPWTPEQTRLLFDWVREALGLRIGLVVPTHYHSDCAGGLAAAHELGAASYAFERTADLARREGRELPQHLFADSLDPRVGDRSLELRYLGAGHTVDNIVVWIPDAGVLFGGCLVRSAGAGSLGYTKEADLEQWPRTIGLLLRHYGDARLIVPGHGSPGGAELPQHTLELLAAQSRQ